MTPASHSVAANARQLAQFAGVTSGVFLAMPRVLRQVRRFDPEQGGLQRIDPKIPSHHLVKIFTPAAVDPPPDGEQPPSADE